MKRGKLTIIIPAFNEKNTLTILLNKILKLKMSKQIILIDDKSTDGTKNIILNYKKKVQKIILHKKNLGKGAAIRSARRFVKGSYVIIQDADLEYDPSDYKHLLKEIKKKEVDVVYGSRVLKNKKYKNIQNFSHGIRIYGNIFLTKISNYINKQKLTDAHTCYKMFKSHIFLSLDLRENGFSFCPEVNTKLSLKKIKITEVPINYSGRTYDQGKKITAFDGIRALVALIKYRFL
jgi:glycosyltransferase involved in cell wall biosynthesis